MLILGFSTTLQNHRIPCTSWDHTYHMTWELFWSYVDKLWMWSVLHLRALTSHAYFCRCTWMDMKQLKWQKDNWKHGMQELVFLQLGSGDTLRSLWSNVQNMTAEDVILRPVQCCNNDEQNQQQKPTGQPPPTGTFRLVHSILNLRLVHSIWTYEVCSTISGTVQREKKENVI